MSSLPEKISLRGAFGSWWAELRSRQSFGRSVRILTSEVWEFLRDSTLERRRRRFGDMEYDWEHRVNTTSGTLGWRERLLGVFHSPYQPTDATVFREMMASLPIDFSQFTFVDLGSGKGRTLLMASEYPFRRILGVEILPELERAAQENLRNYRNPAQRCTHIESICADARDYELPEGPLVLYLFNPLPPAGLRQVLANLASSPESETRAVYVVYHNPLLEELLRECRWLKAIGRGTQYVIYRNGDPGAQRETKIPNSLE